MIKGEVLGLEIPKSKKAVQQYPELILLRLQLIQCKLQVRQPHVCVSAVVREKLKDLFQRGVFNTWHYAEIDASEPQIEDAWNRKYYIRGGPAYIIVDKVRQMLFDEFCQFDKRVK